MTAALDPIKFAKFLIDELSVAETKKYIQQVDERVEYIVETFAKITNRKLEWCEYASDDEQFDTADYAKVVRYNSEVISNRSGYSKYDSEFPTRWFVEDFEPELTTEIIAYFVKLQKQEKTCTDAPNAASQRREQFIKSILSKLLPDELMYVTFNEYPKNNPVVKQMVQNKVDDLKKVGIDVCTEYDRYRKSIPANPLIFQQWVFTKNFQPLIKHGH